MKNKILCEYERKITDAIKADSLGDELRNHLENCADCRETQKIAMFFQNNLAKNRLPVKLPTAGFIWWKASLQKKRAAANRAVKPIYIVQISAITLFSLLLFLVLGVFSQTAFIGVAFAQLFNSFTVIAAPLLMGMLSLIGASLVLAFALRRIYSR